MLDVFKMLFVLLADILGARTCSLLSNIEQYAFCTIRRKPGAKYMLIIKQHQTIILEIIVKHINTFNILR